MKTAIALIFLFVFSACVRKHPTPSETVTTVPSVEKTVPARHEIKVCDATALVLAVNHKTRMVTLKMENGKKAIFKASPEIKRLNEVKKGDTVRAQVYQSLALEVREPTAEETKNPTTVLLAAERGGMDSPPEVAAAGVIHTIVKVVAINSQEETVRVQLPSGKKHTVRAKDPKNLDLIKVGDTIAITYTEALAVSLEPLKKRGQKSSK